MDSMNKNFITRLYDMDNFNKIDIHFARFIAMLAKENDPDIVLASALVSQVTGDGDVCLDLRTYAGKTIQSQKEGDSKIRCPELPIWREKLIACPAVGPPGEKRPLILDQKNRLYLFRYWEYEHNLVEAIQKKAQRTLNNLDYGILKESLRRLFPEVSTDTPDRQKLGAIVAALRNLCVISGGPGTGKTTTIAKILAVLLEQSRDQKLKICLAAPTGKASARMAEAIQVAKQELNCRSHIKDLIPREASTIHRLLKSIPDSPYFYHNAERQLPADLVVVDEASMVDLALMSKLVMALSDDTHLILVGDKDQLASVEAGSVLGDICGHNAKDGFVNDFYQELDCTGAEKLDPIIQQCHAGRGLHDCIVLLKNNYRFAAESGIGGVSRAVNQGNFERAVSLIADTQRLDINREVYATTGDFYLSLKEQVLEGYTRYFETGDPHEAIVRFQEFQILCAVKKGPFGVDAINRFSEIVLMERGLIDPVVLKNHVWYPGRPVLITRNDYQLGLFNGDIGITMPDVASNGANLRVFFPGSDGKPRVFLPHRLPAHETVFAMTIHKSQGSEFDKIVLVLPNTDSPVLTRELLYTGITRAKERVAIWGHDEILRLTIDRKLKRTSGLRDALWDSID